MTYKGLAKHQKLKSRKSIEALFKQGNSTKEYPVMVVTMSNYLSDDTLYQVGFSVSKRNFKRAVDRNRIKRLMRECFRINQSILTQSIEASNTQMVLMFIYLGKELPEFPALEEKIIRILARLAKGKHA